MKIPSLLSLVAFAAVLSGCESEPGSSLVVADGQITDDRIACLPIDEGVELDVELGTGVGVFVEYHGAGLWHLFVTCDTDLSHYSCGWDVVARVDPEIRLEVTDDGEMDEDEDAIDQFDDGGVRLIMRTTSDTDGIFFQTDETASVTFDSLIDGLSDPSTYAWVGDSIQHEGSPTNPIELVPPTSDRECP